MRAHASFAISTLIICSALILWTKESAVNISPDVARPKVDYSSSISSPYPRHWARFTDRATFDRQWPLFSSGVLF